MNPFYTQAPMVMHLHVDETPTSPPACLCRVIEHSSSHYSTCTVGKHLTSKSSHKFSWQLFPPAPSSLKVSKTELTRCFKSDEIEWKIKFSLAGVCGYGREKLILSRWKAGKHFSVIKNSRALILRFIKLHSSFSLHEAQLPHQHVTFLIQL
jgi:hypothetical protein